MLSNARTQLDCDDTLPRPLAQPQRYGVRLHPYQGEIHGYLDHGNFNELLPFNPTAENIAKWICDQIPECYKVSVQESEGNTATYTTDDDEQDI